MSRGYVYVLSNPAMPGLVKIGRTTRSVEARVAELWQTGVPQPFFIECFQLFPNCVEAEAELHQNFSEYRVNDGREFFNVASDVVIDRIHKLLHEKLCDIVSTYSPDATVTNPSEGIALKVVRRCSEEVGIEPSMLAIAAFKRPQEAIWADVESVQIRIAQFSEDEGDAA